MTNDVDSTDVANSAKPVPPLKSENTGHDATKARGKELGDEGLCKGEVRLST